MKLCRQCKKSPLPFIMVFTVASMSGFLMWLTMGLTVSDPLPRAGGSALAFVVAGGIMLQIVLNCLRTHCAPQGNEGQEL